MPMEKTQEHLSFERSQAANEQPSLKRPLATLRNNGQSGVKEFFRILRRRKTSVLGVFVLFMAINALLLTQLSPQYKAESFVIIEGHQTSTADLRDVSVEMPENKEQIKNEIEVIRSRSMAQEVIDRVKLNSLSEFNPNLRPETFYKHIINYLSILRDEPWVVGILGRVAHKKPAGNAAEAERVKIVDNFLEKLEVSPSAASRVIAVGFSSKDPMLAAKVANTVVDVYLSHLVDMRVAAAGKAARWLEEEVRPLRQAVADSERTVEEFRSQSDLLRGGQLTLISEEISEVNRRLAAANAERAEAEANLHEVNSLRGGINSALRVLDSPLIQQLHIQEAAILIDMAELSMEYGSQHPKLINKRAELRDLREKIAAEVAKIIKGYENAMAAASARAVNLQNEVNKLKTQLTEANNHEVQLRALEREAEANRKVLDTFLTRLKETTPQFDPDAQQANARVLSSAEIPENASFPPQKAIFLLATLLSLAFGVGLALLLEHLDPGYRSGEQIEQATKLPVLAMLPMLPTLPSRTGRQGSPESQVLQNRPSLFAEGIRTTYARLALRSRRSPFRTILVTSSMPREGKTSLALCLARLRALTGQKTVVVDADLRRPSINRRLRSPREPGLVELLLGEAELEQVLYRDEQSGAFAIPAGKATFDPTDLLGSAKVEALLELLHKSFELVIFDSPPVITVTDACNLAALVDETLLVVRWGKTARDVVDFALNKISEAKAPAGVVLYMVDPKKIVLYGYGDAAHYDRAVQKYYVGIA